MPQNMPQDMPFDRFRAALATQNPVADLRAGLIGEGAMIPGISGPVPLTYADYVASGRALRQVEDFIQTEVLPYYANSHTEASYCGGYSTRLREAARAEIAALTGAGDDCATIFAGSGATAGINRLVHLLGVNTARHPVVFIGPYEHHSNILPWRESRAKIVEIPEGPQGGPDLHVLAQALDEHADADLKIGAFSAGSNVSGILCDVDAVTRVLRQHQALAVWDYAGAGPYVPVSMGAGDCAKDAVVLSPHKFAGGPGASGVLILRKSAVATDRPSWPGGGTVSFVSPWTHEYSGNIETREEAGTPNVIGDIRAALAMIVKDVAGADYINHRDAELAERALARFASCPNIDVLGRQDVARLPIISMRVFTNAGSPIHQQLFTRMLSDVYGIQARGGCACAGPYAHRLLDIDQPKSEALFQSLQAGHEMEKPGWVRFNLSYLMSDQTVDYILSSIVALAQTAPVVAAQYCADPATARFKPKRNVA